MKIIIKTKTIKNKWIKNAFKNNRNYKIIICFYWNREKIKSIKK